VPNPPNIAEQVARAVVSVRSFDAVVVVGAGMSAAEFPMTGQLPAIVWQAIDSSPQAIEELRRISGLSGHAKGILAAIEEPDVAWALLRHFADARAGFQTAFANLDADRDPMRGHFELARLIRSGHVECVVSYNWDTCLERAYEQLFGVILPNGVLFKPHGDAVQPAEAWTFPDEDGVVPESVIERIADLRDRPRALMVVGYSGRDEVVVQELLQPLSDSWPVIRIGPSATGPDAVALTADDALDGIVEGLGVARALSGWRYVTFDRSRDFSAALRGERLRPADVDACPELPAAARLASRLLSSRFATVSGPSGSGKSITAFHAARRMNRDGWAVLERRGGAMSSQDIHDFVSSSGRNLAVVDDAQALEDSILQDLEASVDDDHAVLLVSTVRLEDTNDETLVADQAKELVFKYCTDHIDEVAPLLMSLDDRVRWSSFAERPDERLELARRSTKEPWLFMFVASGGERRIDGALDRIVDSASAAVALVWICLLQMATRDEGVTRNQLLTQVTATVPAVFSSRSGEQELHRALKLLSDERLINESDGRLRAAHVRIADRVLRLLGLRPEHDIGPSTLTWIKQILVNPGYSLIGKLWLYRTFDRADQYRGNRLQQFSGDEVAAAILAQLESADRGAERGLGLYLIWCIDFPGSLSTETMDRVAGLLTEWIPDVRSDEVYGVQWMLSGLRSSHPETYQRVRSSVSAQALGAVLSRNGSRGPAQDWARLISELMPGWDDSDFAAQRELLIAGIDARELADWLSATDIDSRPWEIYALIETLAHYDPELAATALSACATNIAYEWSRDFIEAGSNFDAWAFGVMLHAARVASSAGVEDNEDVETFEGDEDGADSVVQETASELEGGFRRLGDVALEVMERVDGERSAASLRHKRGFELDSVDLQLFWLGTLSSQILDRIATALPWDWLFAITEGGTASEPRNFAPVEQLLYGFAGSEVSRQLSAEFLLQHDESMPELPGRLVDRFPEIAARRLNEGRAVGVWGPAHRWAELGRSLNRVAAVSRSAAAKYLETMRSAVRQTIMDSSRGTTLNGFREFAIDADRFDDGFLPSIFTSIDLHDVEQGWRARAGDSPGEIAELLGRAVAAGGLLGELAAELLSSAPSAQESLTEI
jgi:hypothetical protein